MSNNISSEFRDLSEIEEREGERLMLNIWGEPKTGKSRGSISFKKTGKLALIDLDFGLRDCHWKYARSLNGDLKYMDMHTAVLGHKPKDIDALIEEMSLEEEKKLVNKTLKAIEWVVEEDFTALAIDGTTRFWNYFQDAGVEIEKQRRGMTKFHPSLHGGPNRAFGQLLSYMSQESGIHFVMTHKTKEEYEKEKGGEFASPTGELKPSQFKHMSFDIDIEIRTIKDTVKNEDGSKETHHFMKITEDRFNTGYENRKFKITGHDLFDAIDQMHDIDLYRR